MIFSSTGGAIYGEQEYFPCRRGASAPPGQPLRSRQVCNRGVSVFLPLEYGIDYLALRYANVYGPRQDPHGEAGVVAIFCGQMLEGKPVHDLRRRLADARLCVRRRRGAGESGRAQREGFGDAINIGTGIETSVNQLYANLASIAGYPTAAEHGPARPGRAETLGDFACARGKGTRMASDRRAARRAG